MRLNIREKMKTILLKMSILFLWPIILFGCMSILLVILIVIWPVMVYLSEVVEDEMGVMKVVFKGA